VTSVVAFAFLPCLSFSYCSASLTLLLCRNNCTILHNILFQCDCHGYKWRCRNNSHLFFCPHVYGHCLLDLRHSQIGANYGFKKCDELRKSRMKKSFLKISDKLTLIVFVTLFAMCQFTVEYCACCKEDIGLVEESFILCLEIENCCFKNILYEAWYCEKCEPCIFQSPTGCCQTIVPQRREVRLSKISQ